MLRKTDDKLVMHAASGMCVRGLSKEFAGQTVLDAVDLDVDQGELITVLGPSGSGKTTLLRLICGFEQADAGSIALGERSVVGADGRQLPPEKRGIGYVAQEGALFPHLTVQENVVFGLPRRQRKLRRGRTSPRVAELLELVGLPAAYALRRPAALSGGEQQRVALARALAPRPDVVLLDEPFSALDAGLRSELRQTVADGLAQVGATALLVTHDQDEALSMGDRVAVLQDGRLAQVDTPETLYRYPVDPTIAQFVGEAVMVPGTIADDSVNCSFGDLPLAPGTIDSGLHTGASAQVMIRPEQFRLHRTSATDGSELQSAQVQTVTYYGHDARVVLETNDKRMFTATVSGVNVPSSGEHVGFSVAGHVVAYPARHDQDEVAA